MNETELRNLILTKTLDELAQIPLTEYDWKRISDMAASMAVWFGVLSHYAEWRGGAACGDHGHEKALAEAHKRRKALRKAVGYSYP